MFGAGFGIFILFLWGLFAGFGFWFSLEFCCLILGFVNFAGLGFLF